MKPTTDMGHPDVLIVQMGRPPQVIVDQLGDQGEWFRAALEPTIPSSPWRTCALAWSRSAQP